MLEGRRRDAWDRASSLTAATLSVYREVAAIAAGLGGHKRIRPPISPEDCNPMIESRRRRSSGIPLTPDALQSLKPFFSGKKR